MMQSFYPLIAQNTANGPAPGQPGAEVLVWLIWLSVAAAAVGVAFWLIRRWVMREADTPMATGFSLAELRQLHQEGHLTDEQFATAKASLIARDLARYGASSEPADTTNPKPADDEEDSFALSDEDVSKDSHESSDKNGQDDRGPAQG